MWAGLRWVSHENIIFFTAYDFESVFYVAYYQQSLLQHAWNIFDKSAYLTDYKTIFVANFDFCETALSHDALSHFPLEHWCDRWNLFAFVATHVKPKKFQIFKRNFLFCGTSFVGRLFIVSHCRLYCENIFGSNIFRCCRRQKNWIND